MESEDDDEGDGTYDPADEDEVDGGCGPEDNMEYEDDDTADDDTADDVIRVKTNRDTGKKRDYQDGCSVIKFANELHETVSGCLKEGKQIVCNLRQMFDRSPSVPIDKLHAKAVDEVEGILFCAWPRIRYIRCVTPIY